MQFILQSRRLGAAALGLSVLGASAITFAAFPTVAQGAVAAVTSVSCSVTGSNWCISGNNSSSGIGVIGTSKSGTGLRGTSTSQYGLKATSGSGEAIFAQTTSGDTAISVLGSSKGNGVNASAGGVGLSGTSTGTTQGTANIGVLGYSKSGTGVYGISSTGTGGYFGSGNAGSAISALTTGSGAGIVVQSTGNQSVALDAKGTNGYGGRFQASITAVLAITPTSGYPFEALGSNGEDIFAVDGHGNVTYTGKLQSMGRTVGGGTARSFSSTSTQPTVEDTGTAQLVRGAAVVALDPTFAASIEPKLAYRVFVTPSGETNGLFVAGKTAAGFIVRESHAGRSTVAFDYRIVATALGAAGQHMAMLSPAEARSLGAHVRMPAAKLPTPAVKPATP